jgi:hypothetical protein
MLAENINLEKKDRRLSISQNFIGKLTNSSQGVMHAANERYVAQEMRMKKTVRSARPEGKVANMFFLRM